MGCGDRQSDDVPAWVRDAAQVLKGNVDRYVFISTISVYGDRNQGPNDENAPLAKYEGADAMKETSKRSRIGVQNLTGR